MTRIGFRRLVLTTAVVLVFSPFAQAAEPARPNLLWITSVDNGPHLGA